MNLLPCALRLEGKKDGQIQSLICHNPACPVYKQQVAPQQCNKCNHRATGGQMKEAAPQDNAWGRPRVLPGGIIAYPQRGWEPPPVPAGYRRKSDNLRNPDAWVFLPVLPTCEHRHQSFKYSPCGVVKIAYTCDLRPDSPVPSTCQECPNAL